MCDCDFDVRIFLCSEDEGLVLLWVLVLLFWMKGILSCGWMWIEMGESEE